MNEEEIINRRISALEAKVAELDARTGRMVVLGPRPAEQKGDPVKEIVDTLLSGTIKGSDFRGRITNDPSDPRLTRGHDDTPVPQASVYLVLSEEERGKGFVRPYRDAYKHLTCGAITTMGRALSETYARDPKFYGGTYCAACRMHRPVSEFVWEEDGQVVGS